MNRQKRNRQARLRARREAPALAQQDRDRSRMASTVRFALRVHDLFRHGFTFTEAILRANE